MKITATELTVGVDEERIQRLYIQEDIEGKAPAILSANDSSIELIVGDDRLTFSRDEFDMLVKIIKDYRIKENVDDFQKYKQEKKKLDDFMSKQAGWEADGDKWWYASANMISDNEIAVDYISMIKSSCEVLRHYKYNLSHNGEIYERDGEIDAKDKNVDTFISEFKKRH